MSTKVWDLYADISLDNSSYVEGLNKSENAGKSFEEKLKKNTENTKEGFDNLSSAVSSLKKTLSSVEIGSNFDKIQKGVTEATEETSQFGDGIDDINYSLQELDKIFEDLEEEQRTLHQESMDRLFSMYDSVDDLGDAFDDSGDDAEDFGEEVGNAMSESEDSIEDVTEALDDAGDSSTSFEKKAVESAEKTKTGFDNLSSVVSLCKTALASVGVGFTLDKVIKELSEAYTEASKLDVKLRGASTLYGTVAVNQTKLSDNLKKISLETGESLETLGQTVYDAMSAGVEPTEDMAEVLEVVSTSSKLAKAGFTDTNTAMKASLSVINAYGMEIKEVERVSDILLQTQNLGVTTVGELGSALSKVTPTASAFGVSIENVTTAIALMTKQGTKTEVATTGLSSILSELGKSGTTASENLRKASESAGLAETSFTELLDSGKSLGDILSIMNDYAVENNLSLVDMFSSIEAGKSALQLTNGGAKTFNETLEKMSTATGLVQDGFEAMLTPTEKLDSALATLKTTIGEKLQPVVDSFKESTATLITKMLGQEEKAEDLETAMGDLKDALDNYSLAQENAKEKTDATTESMKLMAQDSVRSALKVLGASWEAFEGNLNSTEDQISKVRDEYTKLGEKIIYYAGTGEYGLKLVGDEEFENLQSFEEQVEYAITALIKHAQTLGTYADGTDNVMKTNIIAWAKAYYDLKETLKDLEEQQENNNKKFEETADVLASYVESGELSLNEIYIYSQSLYDDVVAILSDTGRKYKSMGESVEETNNDIEESTTQAVDTLRMKLDLMEKKIADDIPVSFSSSKKVFSDLTSSFIENIDEINTSLLTLPSDSEYQELFGLNLAPIIITKMITGIGNAKESFSDFESSATEDIENLYDLLSTPPTPKKLTPFLVDTSPITRATTEFSKASKSILNDTNLSKVEIYNALKDLSEDFDLTLSDMTILSQAKAEANREIWQDFASGFKADMKDTFSSTLQSFETLGEAIADGGDMWDTFGSMALKALKQILESLGNQLTALAVTKAVMGDWIGAGLATTGAILAYTGAGVANSNATKLLNKISSSSVAEAGEGSDATKAETDTKKERIESLESEVDMLQSIVDNLETGAEIPEQYQQDVKIRDLQERIRELESKITSLQDKKDVTINQYIDSVPMTPYELEQQAYIMAERLQWS